MHIPDGFMATKVWISASVASIGTVAFAAAKSKEVLKDKRVPLMGVTAAFIFAAQMINFPVAGGTSGHFLGAALVAIFLGPWAAVLIMSAVLIVQMLLFADGGVTALGINILNMGIISVFVSFWVYVILKRFTAKTIAVFISAWLSVVAASALVAIELAISGISPLTIVGPAMLGWHVLIGAIEGSITVVIVSTVAKSRPDLLEGARALDTKGAFAGILISLLTVIFLSPIASSLPDGLERTALDLGFANRQVEHQGTVMEGYATPGISDRAVSTAIAGFSGVIVLLATAYLFTVWLAKRSRSTTIDRT